MHTRHGLKIADRIHLLLVREIGQGLDRQRMVKEPLYARDVLLVCDALHGTDAAFLAGHFRRAAVAVDEAEEARSGKDWTLGMSGWLNSLFGMPAESQVPRTSKAVRQARPGMPAR